MVYKIDIIIIISIILFIYFFFLISVNFNKCHFGTLIEIGVYLISCNSLHTFFFLIIFFTAFSPSIVNVQSTLRRNLTLMQGGTYGRGMEVSRAS